jgi:HK97 family phage prohead protease
MKTFRKLLESKPAGSGSSPPLYRITSTKLDRHQDRVLGLDAEGSEFRVPLLWNHDSWGPPIGYARCFKEGDEWLAEPHFDRADERSRVIADKAQAGSINTCSIGFLPSSKVEPVPNQDGGYDFPLVRVVELSLCNVPANEDAVRVRAVGAEDSAHSPAEVLKAFREAHAAFLALASEMKSLVQGLSRKATPVKTTEEEEPGAEESEDVPEPDAEEPEGAAAGEADEADEELEGKETASAEEETPDEDGELEDEDAPEEASSNSEDGAEETPSDEELDAEGASEGAPDEDAESEDEDDAEEDEEELKAMRVRVAKALGFSKAQADELPLVDVRAYAALLTPTR